MAKAQAVVDEWEAKASAARAEAAEIERGSGAAILADPSAAEKISIKVDAKQRTARAYDSAAAESLEQVRAAWRKAVEAEAKQLEKDAVNFRKEAAKIEAEESKLIDKLEALQGVRYEPVLGRPTSLDHGVYVRGDDLPRQTRSDDLKARAGGAEAQTKMVRHALETGQTNGYDGQSLIGHLDTPPVLAAALNAGAL
ncbi:hypothetical protein [Brevibacterium casei]|uniref:hypothetical protein n=1 Tax=Brevibacterium casei TaxID=33889 RepID=UPI0012E78792|nr:hypothetical protein [Brevibacterium casei]